MQEKVLDVCCGAKMFWFDKQDPRAEYLDNRCEEHRLKDSTDRRGYQPLLIDPDYIADFRNLPYDANTWPLVVFDPPHFKRNGKSGWLYKKYGRLGENWQDDIRRGFNECFRVLKPEGVLVFKWTETEVKTSEIIQLAPERPLFGNRCGKAAQTHWIVFMKSGESFNA